MRSSVDPWGVHEQLGAVAAALAFLGRDLWLHLTGEDNPQHSKQPGQGISILCFVYAVKM